MYPGLGSIFVHYFKLRKQPGNLLPGLNETYFTSPVGDGRFPSFSAVPTELKLFIHVDSGNELPGYFRLEWAKLEPSPLFL
jgi:hypothetical protein